MGNYTKLYGEICLKENNLKEFKKKYNKTLSGWLCFDKLFIVDKNKEYSEIRLNFNPFKHSFKLLGYPSNFEEFLGFFRDNLNLIEYFKIIGYVEDDLFFIFEADSNETPKHKLKMFKIKDIHNYEYCDRCHGNFLKV